MLQFGRVSIDQKSNLVGALKKSKFRLTSLSLSKPQKPLNVIDKRVQKQT